MSNEPHLFSIRWSHLTATVAVAVSLVACNTSTPNAPTSAATQSLPTAVLSTVTPAPTSAPVQAPAGLTVAFVADGTLWLWRTHEDPVPLTTAEAFPAPQLSSDGSWIAFARAGNAVVIGSDGANEQVVQVAGTPGQISWRPGHAEAYLTTPAEGETVLQRFDPATGALTEIGRFGADAAFTFAPDGEHLAVVTADRLQLADAEGVVVGDALDYPAVAVSDTQQWRPTPVWVADAVVRLFTVTETGSAAETIVWEASLDAAPSEVTRQVGAAFGGLLSPDGRRLLFVQADSTLGLWDLETGEARQVLDAPGSAALAWTPDSAAYVYTGIDPLQPFVIGLEPDSVPHPVGGGVLSLRWLTADWVLFTTVAGAGEQLRLAEVGASDGLLGISAAGAIGYDARVAP